VVVHPPVLLTLCLWDRNLKAAQKLGMETIHVPLGGSLAAVKQLEEKLGIDLTSPSSQVMDIGKL